MIHCKNILLPLLFLFPNISQGQRIKEFLVDFKNLGFSYEQNEKLLRISSKSSDTFLWGDTLDPALPFISVNILISPTENYKGFSFDDNEELVLSSVVIEPNPLPVPTKSLQSRANSRLVAYTQAVYPQMSIEYTGTHLMDGYKYLSFVVCPFRYDAVNKRLYLKRDMKIRLQLDEQTSSETNIATSGECSYGNNMREAVMGLIVNGNELNTLYPQAITSNKSLLSLVSYPYKYIIVTNETLRPAFEKLAHWKTLKGVRTKVITVEDCYDDYPNYTPQLAIKTVLATYYNNSMEYALLGGDVDIVPAQICYLPSRTSDTSDTPADLYYACLDNNFAWDANGNSIYGEDADNVDYDPEFIVTRVSVSTLSEAEIMVNRIIEYESSPNFAGWTNNMLSCGNKLYVNYLKNGLQISDAQYQGEYVYENGVQPYWNGSLFELFDTYTDHTNGANYEANGEHIQTELEKGYTFVDEFSHGWANKWGWLENWTLYKLDKASSLVNSGYSIITTIACYTNAFDKVSSDFPNETDYYTTCLSESFIRNPNSGILGYFGSSREGWSSTSYYFNYKFYQNLLSGSDKQFGRAAMLAKNAYLSNITSNDNNNYSWLIKTLNPIGDPEMPIYVGTPLTFSNTNISFSNGTLSVTTGVSGCSICVSSVADFGDSYYELSTNANTGSFSGVVDDCYLCITKPGYIPYVARVGTSVYLQNETIIKDLPIFSTNTYAGSNVTTTKPQGPVSIEGGKVISKSSGNFTIQNNFEVKVGAQLDIQVQ